MGGFNLGLTVHWNYKPFDAGEPARDALPKFQKTGEPGRDMQFRVWCIAWRQKPGQAFEFGRAWPPMPVNRRGMLC